MRRLPGGSSASTGWPAFTTSPARKIDVLDARRGRRADPALRQARVSACASVASAARTAASAAPISAERPAICAASICRCASSRAALSRSKADLAWSSRALAEYAALEQRLLPLELAPRESRAGALRAPPAPCRTAICSGRCRAALRLASCAWPGARRASASLRCAFCIGRFEREQELALLHLIARLDLQPLDAAAVLRRHEDEVAFDVALKPAGCSLAAAPNQPAAAARPTSSEDDEDRIRMRFMAPLRLNRAHQESQVGVEHGLGVERLEALEQVAQRSATIAGRDRRVAESARARPSGTRRARPRPRRRRAAAPGRGRRPRGGRIRRFRGSGPPRR